MWRMRMRKSEQMGVAPTDESPWVDISPSNGPPYEYATRKEAEHMLDICYREVRRGFYTECEVGVYETH